MKTQSSPTQKHSWPEPVLVRLPNSHTKMHKVGRCLGYEPHQFVCLQREGYWAQLPPSDAQKVLDAKLATRTRVTIDELNGCWYSGDPYRGTPPKNETCQHAPARLYAWHDGNGQPCARCCECGTLVKL